MLYNILKAIEEEIMKASIEGERFSELYLTDEYRSKLMSEQKPNQLMNGLMYICMNEYNIEVKKSPNQKNFLFNRDKMNRHNKTFRCPLEIEKYLNEEVITEINI